MKSYLQKESISVPQNGSPYKVNALGDKLYFTAANGPFEFSFDGQNWVKSMPGRGYSLVPGEVFDALYFRNVDLKNVRAILVEFNFGTIDLFDAGMFVTANTSQQDASALFVRDNPTRVFSSTPNLASLTVLDATYFLDNAGYDEGMQQKRVVITNDHATRRVEVRNPDGKTIGMVYPKTAQAFDCIDFLTLNPVDGAVTCYVAGYFYQGHTDYANFQS